MASEIGNGTPLLPTVVTGNLTSTPDTSMTTKVTTNNAPKQYPIRFNIRIKNREANVNPFAAIKSFLTELTTHAPTAKLGAHSEIFYSSTDFPSTEKDFNDAFHGKVADHENQKFKPFFHESVGNGLSVCTWCYLHTTLSMKRLHTRMFSWLSNKQIFIEPVSNGYYGPRETVGYLTNLNLTYTFRSNLIRTIQSILDSTMTSSSTDMDTSGHPSSHPDPVLPKVEIIRSRLHINTPKHCFANVLTLAVRLMSGHVLELGV